MLAFTQNMIWNTWGPISNSAEFAFGWNNSTIFLMTNWGPISFILSAFVFSWMLYKSKFIAPHPSVQPILFILFRSAVIYGFCCCLRCDRCSGSTFCIYTAVSNMVLLLQKEAYTIPWKSFNYIYFCLPIFKAHSHRAVFQRSWWTSADGGVSGHLCSLVSGVPAHHSHRHVFRFCRARSVPFFYSRLYTNCKNK